MTLDKYNLEYCKRCGKRKDTKIQLCHICAGDWFCCGKWQFARGGACSICYKHKPERDYLKCADCGNEQYWKMWCQKCESYNLYCKEKCAQLNFNLKI